MGFVLHKAKQKFKDLNIYYKYTSSFSSNYSSEYKKNEKLKISPLTAPMLT